MSILWVVAAFAGVDVGEPAITLDNGLKVVFVEDHSDPLVSVVLQSQFGSSHEAPYQTGWTALLGEAALTNADDDATQADDDLFEELGGTRTSSVTHDHTRFATFVEANGLERVLWAMSNQVADLPSQLTDGRLEAAKAALSDSRVLRTLDGTSADDLASRMLDDALYPADHPYGWAPIPPNDTLDAVTVDDLRTLHGRVFGAANTTLAIVGDFDADEAKGWVQTYFADLPTGEATPARDPKPISLDETVRMHRLSPKAKTSNLRWTWPTVPAGHADAAPLKVLMGVLGREVTSDREMRNETFQTGQVGSDLAGYAYLEFQMRPGNSLFEVRKHLEETMERIDADGLPVDTLDRTIKAALTEENHAVDHPTELAPTLADDIADGTPGQINDYLDAVSKVTVEDVQRVWKAYVKGKPHAEVAVVPTDNKLDLPPKSPLHVWEEAPTADRPADLPAAGEPGTQRAQKPKPEIGPQVKPRLPFERMTVAGRPVLFEKVENKPKVSISMVFDGGTGLDTPKTSGLGHALAAMLTKGTETRTPKEFRDDLDAAGANLTASNEADRLVITLRVAPENLDDAVALLEATLAEPRLDKPFLERRIGQAVRPAAAQASKGPAINALAVQEALYPDGHPAGASQVGRYAALKKAKTGHLKKRRKMQLIQERLSFVVLGGLDTAQVEETVSRLVAAVPSGKVKTKAPPSAEPLSESKVIVIPKSFMKEATVTVGFRLPPATGKTPVHAVVQHLLTHPPEDEEEMEDEVEGEDETGSEEEAEEDTKPLPPPVMIRTNSRSGGYGRFEATVDRERMVEAIEGYKKAFTDLADPAVTPDEHIAETLRSMKSTLLRDIHPWNRRAQAMMDSHQFGLDDPSDMFLQSVTIADVREAAKQLADANQVIAVYGTAKKIVPLLEPLGLPMEVWSDDWADELE